MSSVRRPAAGAPGAHPSDDEGEASNRPACTPTNEWSLHVRAVLRGILLNVLCEQTPAVLDVDSPKPVSST
jgi:hypothetical protein